MTNEETKKMLEAFKNYLTAGNPIWHKDEVAEAFDLAIAALERDRWISVEERLPEENEAVNIIWINRSPVIYYQDIKDKPQSATGVYYRGDWYWWSAVVQDYLAEYGKWEPDKMDSAIEVTHWMPLPEPPKEDKP